MSLKLYGLHLQILFGKFSWDQCIDLVHNFQLFFLFLIQHFNAKTKNLVPVCVQAESTNFNLDTVYIFKNICSSKRKIIYPCDLMSRKGSEY